MVYSQWNTSFGAPTIQTSPVPGQAGALSVPSSAASDTASLHDIQAAQAQLQGTPQPITVPQFPPTQVQTFVTPAMWQESVASVYEGGLKRSNPWDYDSQLPIKRR